jgi:hypothetical protein
MSLRARWRRMVARYRAVERFHDDLFVAPWRAGVARQARDQQELLVTLVFLEALGVEHPAPLVSLELFPELIEGYHDWHRRRGLDDSPMPGVCC